MKPTFWGIIGKQRTGKRSFPLPEWTGPKGKVQSVSKGDNTTKAILQKHHGNTITRRNRQVRVANAKSSTSRSLATRADLLAGHR